MMPENSSKTKYEREGNYHWREYYGKKAVPQYQKHVNKIISFFKDRKGNLLDVGCGDGLILNELNKIKGLKCFGIDNCPMAIQMAHQRKVSNCSAIDFFEFKEEKFDYIFMGDCLEHIKKQEKALVKAHRMLKENGILYISLPTKKDKYDLYFIPENIATELIKKFFRIISIEQKPNLKKIYFVVDKGNPNTKEWWGKKFRNEWGDIEFIISRRLNKYEFLLNTLPKDKKFSLLDIGCAIGYGLALIKKNFPLADLYALDISEVAIQIAREKYPNIKFESGDIQNYKFTRKYTYVTIIRTLEHLTKPFAIIDKCLKYATDAVIVSTPDLKPRYGHVNYFHLHDFNDYVFDELPSKKGLNLIIYRKKDTQNEC